MAQNHEGVDGAGLTQPEGPILCINNCGCFGCASTMNLCSKCYRDVVLKKEGSSSSSSAVASSPRMDRAFDEKPLFSLLAQKPHPPAVPLEPEPATVAEAYSSGAGLPPRGISDVDLDAAGRSRSHEDEPVAAPRLSGACEPRAPVNVARALPQAQAQSQALAPASQSVTASPARPPASTPTNRCLWCRKRVGLLGFKCRCGDVFCSLHRHSYTHDCSFDYKAAGREAIAKANPLVRAPKVDKL